MDLEEAYEILNRDFWDWISQSIVVEDKELEALQIAIDCVKKAIKEKNARDNNMGAI